MDRPLRKDAAERRDAVLKAATLVFSQHGPDAPLELVAEKAGVGRATLYRNFPDRTALALAVFTDELDKLEAALRAQPLTPETFFHFLDELVALQLRNAGLSSALRGISTSEVLEPLRSRLIRAGEKPLREAQRAGLVRTDIKPSDLRVIASMLSAAQQFNETADRKSMAALAKRLLLDGLRQRP